MAGFASAYGIRSIGPEGRHIPMCVEGREDTGPVSSPSSRPERHPEIRDAAVNGVLEYDKMRSLKRPSIVRQISEPVTTWVKRVHRNTIRKGDGKSKVIGPGSAAHADLPTLDHAEIITPRREIGTVIAPTDSSAHVDHNVSPKALRRIRSAGSLRPSSAASTITERFPEYVDLSPPEPFHNTHFGASQQPNDSRTEHKLQNKLPGCFAERGFLEEEELDKQWQDVLNIAGVSLVDSDMRRQGLE